MIKYEVFCSHTGLYAGIWSAIQHLFNARFTCMFINDAWKPNDAQRHTITEAIHIFMLVNASLLFRRIKGHWERRANSDHRVRLLMLEQGEPGWKYKDPTSFHFICLSLLKTFLLRWIAQTCWYYINDLGQREMVCDVENSSVGHFFKTDQPICDTSLGALTNKDQALRILSFNDLCREIVAR